MTARDRPVRPDCPVTGRRAVARSYFGMNAAIALPDARFQSAGALAEYLGNQQTRKLTDRLNAVYATELSHLEPALRQAQRRSPGE